MAAGRDFANMVHPNAVVARREQERQATGIALLDDVVADILTTTLAFFFPQIRVLGISKCCHIADARVMPLVREALNAASKDEPAVTHVIFLDIDGVLNRTRAATHIRLDEDLMLLLKDFVHQSDAHIVLSTYWRHFTEYIRYVLTRYDIPGWKVLGATPGLGHLQGSCFDDKVYASRSEEICAWLQDHPTVSHFVILDDRRTAGFGALAPHFVHCRSELGLTKEDVQLALEILQLPRAALELDGQNTWRVVLPMEQLRLKRLSEIKLSSSRPGSARRQERDAPANCRDA
eukprot:s649_g37.t2